MLKFALLGVLNYQSMNGYEIKQFMDSSTGHFWYAKLSQIYMTLKSLEENGLLISEVKPQEDRPDRRMYTITEAGRAALRRWLAEPVTEVEPTKEPLLLKLFFAAQLDKDTILTQLHLQRTLHQQSLEAMAASAQIVALAVEQNPALAKDALLWEAVRQAGERSERLYVDWLDDTIKLVQAEF